MNKRLLILSFCLSVGVLSLRSQEERVSKPTTLSLLAGYGSSSVLETYLSPYSYAGTNFRLIGEAFKVNRNEKYAHQHLLNLEYSNTTNFSGRGQILTGFFNYSYGLFRCYKPSAGLSLLAGGASDVLIGAIYNTRNSNNPAQAKVNVNFNLSGIATYNFSIKKIPFTLRYQIQIPVLGAGFSPEYGQSYYEIFSLNNTKGIVHLLSVHNQWAMQNLITLEVPIYGTSMRFGYYNNIYQSRINNLETSLISHNFVVGFSADLLRVRRRK